MEQLPARSPMWNNPLAKGLYVRRGRSGVVWMPSAYDEKKRYPFRPLQLRFLHAYASGENIQDICAKLELTQEEAFKLLNKPKCREYLAELESMDAELVGKTTKTRLRKGLLDVWEGKTVKDREQMEAMKELLARCDPRPEKLNGSGGDQINITINLGKVAEAISRQEAINAEVIAEVPT